MISEPIYTSSGSSSTHYIFTEISSVNNLTIISLLLSAAILGVVVATDKNKIRFIFDALLSDRILSQDFKDKTSFTNRSTLLLFANYILCFSLLSIVANQNYRIISWSSTQIILATTGIVISLFVIKRLIILISGEITGLQSETQEYLFNHSIFTLTAGIALIPILIIFNFTKLGSESLTLYSLIFLLLFIALRLAKIMSLSIKRRTGNLLYLLLYICTLEILPLIALYKAFVSEIG